MITTRDFRTLLPSDQRALACAALLTQVGNHHATISRQGRHVYVHTAHGSVSLHAWTLAWQVGTAVREFATGGAR